MGLRRRQLAAAAQLALELKQSSSRHSLSCPDLSSLGPPKTNSQRLPPLPLLPRPKKQLTFRNAKSRFVLCSMPGAVVTGMSRDPMSCRTDLALAQLLLLLTLRQVASLSSCPFELQGNCRTTLYSSLICQSFSCLQLDLLNLACPLLLGVSGCFDNWLDIFKFMLQILGIF